MVEGVVEKGKEREMVWENERESELKKRDTTIIKL